MFKKKVVSLLCAAALTVTSFSGVAFAEEPLEAPKINLIPVNKTVQPYEDAEYYLSLNIPEGVVLAGAQIMLDDSNADYTFDGFAPGINMNEISCKDNGNNVMFLLSGPDGALGSYEGEVNIGVVKFDKIDNTSEGSFTPEIVFYETDNPTIGTTPDVKKVALKRGTVLPVESEFSAEISLVANDVAEMAYSYDMKMVLDNAAELAEAEHGVAVLEFDIQYDSSKFIFNTAFGPLVKDGALKAVEESDGVVHVTADALGTDADGDPITSLEKALGTLRFKTLVAPEFSAASFKFAGEIAGWANMEDMTFGGMSVTSTGKDVTFSRANINALLSAAEGVTVHDDYSKVDVVSGQQEFSADKVFDLAKVEEARFELAVKDVNGGNLIGTTSRFVMTDTFTRNALAGENEGIGKSQYTVGIYDMVMRLKGDVSLQGNSMDIVNISDLSVLKSFILSYDFSWTAYGEDIQWAATNIAFPEENSKKVFVYDLAATKNIILGVA